MIRGAVDSDPNSSQFNGRYNSLHSEIGLIRKWRTVQSSQHPFGCCAFEGICMMDGSGMMPGGMIVMSVLGILVLVNLVLGAAALWKYLRS